MRNVKLLLLTIFFTLSSLAMANSAREIEKDADETIKIFYNEVKGSKAFLKKAKAYLIFPDIKEAGFFLGGKYGEGVLRVRGKSKAYYSVTAASVGFQMGMKAYGMIIAFTTDDALNKFLLDDDEWEADVDGNIAVAEWNSKEELEDTDFGESMVAFVLDYKGMMGSLTMEGTKFKRIHPDE